MERHTLVRLFLICYLMVVCIGKMQAQIITTIAGSGSPAPTTGIAAYSCVLDNKGNLYFTEMYQCKVRMITAAGIVKTIAGNGSMGYNGDGIPATSAMLNYPIDVAVDTAGNVFFSDVQNNRIRRIDAATGIITTVAGNGTISHDYINGAPATGSIGYIGAMCLDRCGNIYISNHLQVCKVDTAGIIRLVAGVYSPVSTPIPSYYPSQPATAAGFHDIDALCVDTAGNLYMYNHFVPDHSPTAYNGIMKVNVAGILSQYAGSGYGGHTGDGGPATNAKIEATHLTMDRDGNLYFSTYNAVRKVDPSGMICTVAGNGIDGYSGDNGPATAAQFHFTVSVATDTSGNVYVVDFGDYGCIRKVTQPLCGYIFITDTTVDTAMIEKIKEISLSPNPAINELIIAAPDTITHISIYDFLGRMIYAHEYYSNYIHLDVADLPKGTYIVKINGSETRKFVKH